MAKLKTIAETLGWEYQKGYIYGVEEHYVFTVRQISSIWNTRGNSKLVYIPLINITNEQINLVNEYLHERRKDLYINNYTFSNHVLILKLEESLKGYTVEQFKNLVKEIIEFIKTNTIVISKTCVYCDEEGVDSITKIHKIAYWAHKSCSEKE